MVSKKYPKVPEAKAGKNRSSKNQPQLSRDIPERDKYTLAYGEAGDNTMQRELKPYTIRGAKPGDPVSQEIANQTKKMIRQKFGKKS